MAFRVARRCLKLPMMHKELDDDGGKEARKHVPKFANHLDGCLSEDKQISMGQYRFRRCIEGSENELSCWEMKSLDNRNRLLGG